MPGMEARAPLRQLSSSGFSGSPNFMPIASSVLCKAAATSSRSDCGNCRPWAKKTVQKSVLMVKPAGTGRASFAISARFAPLPPKRVLHRRIAFSPLRAEEVNVFLRHG